MIKAQDERPRLLRFMRKLAVAGAIAATDFGGRGVFDSVFSDLRRLCLLAHPSGCSPAPTSSRLRRDDIRVIAFESLRCGCGGCLRQQSCCSKNACGICDAIPAYRVRDAQGLVGAQMPSTAGPTWRHPWRNSRAADRSVAKPAAARPFAFSEGRRPRALFPRHRIFNFHPFLWQ